MCLIVHVYIKFVFHTFASTMYTHLIEPLEINRCRRFLPPKNQIIHKNTNTVEVMLNNAIEFPLKTETLLPHLTFMNDRHQGVENLFLVETPGYSCLKFD